MTANPQHAIPQPPHIRYSSRPFPPYRFIIGEHPHPVADKEGHSFGQEHESQILTTENWRTNEDYLYAIDLYNYAYWWEAHEALEGLWGHFARGTPESDLLQGVIKIAAAFYKWHLHSRGGVMIHYAGGTGLLKEACLYAPEYMGIDLKGYLERLEKHFEIVIASEDAWPDALVGYPFIDLKIEKAQT